MSSKGWSYKTNQEFYLKRDRALVAVTYLLAGRISEVLRLKLNQITPERDRLVIRAIQLSKARRKGEARHDQYRQEAYLPLNGDRARLTQFLLDYQATLTFTSKEESLLFPFGESRAWQIITALTGEPCHWLRAYGENYLYDHWDHDILAVADYIKVDARTLGHYIRRSYEKYRPV